MTLSSIAVAGIVASADSGVLLVSLESAALATPLAVGALVLLVSLLQVRSLVRHVEEPRHRQYWMGAGLLVGCLAVGFVAAVVGLFLGARESLLPLTGALGLLGAVFVLIVISIGDQTIEELVRSRDELERREEEFERLYEVTDVLNRILRHNLRNNMNVILGRSDMIRTEAEDEQEVEHVAAIKAEAERLVEIGEKARAIHDTLDTDIDAAVRPAERFVAPVVDGIEAEYPDATVSLDADEDLWISVGPLFETAIENVLDNAVRHNDGTATVEVRLSASDEAVSIAVADDGPGIHPYEVEAITEHRETPLQHGSGLGLWLASWIVDQYGGEITFEDNEPRGTVVTLSLPRVEAPDVETAAADRPGAGDGPGEPVGDGGSTIEGGSEADAPAESTGD